MIEIKSFIKKLLIFLVLLIIIVKYATNKIILILLILCLFTFIERYYPTINLPQKPYY